MKKTLVIIIVLQIFFICSLLSANNLSPIGYWKTIDDETGKVKSVVQVWEENNKLHGKIVKLFRKPDEDQNPVCAKGSGKLTGKPMLGATIMRNLKKDGEWWDNGKITDPKKGKTYHCKIRVIDDGKKLQVRGYIKAIIKIGRSQIWLRTDKPKFGVKHP